VIVYHPKANHPMRLAVFISGTGRSLHNMIQKIESGDLNAEIRVVISSTPNAKGLQYAEKSNIPIEVIESTSFASREEYSAAMFDRARDAEADIVALAGFIKRLVVPDNFVNRVLNIHPSLMPAFCGQGFYGHHVHEAALAYGVKVSGCTVHFVDNEYDHGPVIIQLAVPVHESDTPDSLETRVFAAECEAYPKALQLIATGQVMVTGRRVRIVSKD
jgi:formyltetrahydrofolate-dependent phosphoribosylglycinamide formyltransferase